MQGNRRISQLREGEDIRHKSLAKTVLPAHLKMQFLA
jgi:hypothetical protein